MNNQLALAVGAMLEAQTPHPRELSKVWPVPTERQERREQGGRLLTHPRRPSPVLVAPFARTGLAEAARHGQTLWLSRDHPDLGDRFAV